MTDLYEGFCEHFLLAHEKKCSKKVKFLGPLTLEFMFPVTIRKIKKIFNLLFARKERIGL